MVRLALFDIDGTLIRTGGAGVKAFERVGAIGFGVPDGVGHIRFAGRTDLSLVREFFVHHRIAPSRGNFQRFLSLYVFLLEDLLGRHRGGPCPGVWAFLQGLQALPQPPMLGLLTGNIRLGAEIKLRHYGLWEPFAVGGFGDDHEDRNRIAAIVQERARRVLGDGLPGQDVLVVGDTPFDIACGRAIGARVLAVATGGAASSDLRQATPDWLVPNLGEASAAEVCA